MILIDLVFRVGKNYYPEIFLEECKYILEEKTVRNFIIDDTEISSGSYEEIMEKIQKRKQSSEEESSEEDSNKIFLFLFVCIKNKNHKFTEEKKRRQFYQECKKELPDYIRNYYLRHKK